MNKLMVSVMVMTGLAIGSAGGCASTNQANSPGGAAADQGASDPGGDVRTYKTTPQGDLEIELFFPADWREDDQRPAIVFFFGGKWARGHRSQFYAQCAYLAERGMVAATADYRVATIHGTTPDECVEDARTAIRWLKSNAGELGIDPEKVLAGGGSAGGHIAAAAAWCPELDAPDDEASISPRPAALVLFNPVLNKTMRVRNVRGQPRYSDEERQRLVERISPNHHLTSGGPPTIVFFGSNDNLIGGAYEHLELSAALNNRVELHVAEGAGHGFFNRSPWLESTLVQADRFLASLGYLDGEPTLAAPADASLELAAPGAASDGGN